MGRGNCHYLHLVPFDKEYLPSSCLISESVNNICSFLLMTERRENTFQTLKGEKIIVMIKFSSPDQHKKISYVDFINWDYIRPLYKELYPLYFEGIIYS